MRKFMFIGLYLRGEMARELEITADHLMVVLPLGRHLVTSGDVFVVTVGECASGISCVEGRELLTFLQSLHRTVSTSNGELGPNAKAYI